MIASALADLSSLVFRVVSRVCGEERVDAGGRIRNLNFTCNPPYVVAISTKYESSVCLEKRQGVGKMVRR
jgi:hypothetical protein